MKIKIKKFNKFIEDVQRKSKKLSGQEAREYIETSVTEYFQLNIDAGFIHEELAASIVKVLLKNLKAHQEEGKYVIL